MTLFNRYLHEIDSITEFKEAFIEYNLLGIERGRLTPAEEADKIQLREKLNILNGEVQKYVNNSGVAASIYYTPPPAVGGMGGTIEFFSNLFNLHRFSISPQMVIDSLDRSIGNYQYFRKQYVKKLTNPLYWLGEVIRIPFHLLKFAGFNSKNIELSIFGKIYKLITPLLVLLATILTILNLFGFNTTLPKETKHNAKKPNYTQEDTKQKKDSSLPKKVSEKTNKSKP